MIKGLLKKDLYNISSYKTSLVIIILFCSIAIIGTEAINFGSIIICTIVGMIALSTFNYDEISKSNKYILALPTNKKEIVKEKFILCIMSVVIGGILGFILTVVVANLMNYLRPQNLINIDYETLIISTIGGMWGISLIQSIQIPSIFKWGAEKGRIQMFVILFILIGAFLGIGFLITKLSININIEMIDSLINKFEILFLVLTMVLMYYISYKISYKIFKNKEE